MLIFKRRTVSIAEFWFDEEIRNPAVDVIRIIQRSSPLENKKWEEFYTIVVDIKQDEEAIFNSMDSVTRRYIRRVVAEDHLTFEGCCTDEETIEKFVIYYNEFAQIKGIPQIRSKKLKEYASIGRLDISKVLDADGGVISWLVYYKDSGRVRALYNCSNYVQSQDTSYRNLIGRANRFLHWQDMLKFKAQQITDYDLGGWYPGDKDLAKLGINRFKEGLGGAIVKNFNQEFGVTLKGKIYIFLNRIRDNWIEAIETRRGMKKK
jgi:hypothetical protein